MSNFPRLSYAAAGQKGPVLDLFDSILPDLQSFWRKQHKDASSKDFQKLKLQLGVLKSNYIALMEKKGGCRFFLCASHLLGAVHVCWGREMSSGHGLNGGKTYNAMPLYVTCFMLMECWWSGLVQGPRIPD